MVKALTNNNLVGAVTAIAAVVAALGVLAIQPASAKVLNPGSLELKFDSGMMKLGKTDMAQVGAPGNVALGIAGAVSADGKFVAAAEEITPAKFVINGSDTPSPVLLTWIPTTAVTGIIDPFRGVISLTGNFKVRVTASHVGTAECYIGTDSNPIRFAADGALSSATDGNRVFDATPGGTPQPPYAGSRFDPSTGAFTLTSNSFSAPAVVATNSCPQSLADDINVEQKTKTHQEITRDANGDPVLDANGDPVTHDVTTTQKGIGLPASIGVNGISLRGTTSVTLIGGPDDVPNDSPETGKTGNGSGTDGDLKPLSQATASTITKVKAKPLATTRKAKSRFDVTVACRSSVASTPLTCSGTTVARATIRYRSKTRKGGKTVFRTVRKKVTLGTKRFTVASGKTVAFKFTLSKKAKSLLAKSKRMPTTVTTTLIGGPAKPAASSARVTLKAKKTRKRA